MSKEDSSFILKKAGKCKYMKFSLIQYFLMKAHTKAQHFKMLSMRHHISKIAELIPSSCLEFLKETMVNSSMGLKGLKLHL